jgi:DNA-binding GntR family transcriptional regulator
LEVLTLAVPIRRKLAEDIADYLTERIVQMQIRPGERITEAKIREIFEVSGSPVREALMILEKKHLVELIPRCGAKATEMSPEFISNLYDVMTELAGILIRRVCEDHTEEELNWFLEMVSKALDCARNNDVHGYFEAIRITSLGVVEISRNPLLAGIVMEWIPSFQRANFLFLLHSSYNLEDHVKSFQELSQHVVENNAEMAEWTARSLFGREQERVLEIVRKYFSEEETGG